MKITLPESQKDQIDHIIKKYKSEGWDISSINQVDKNIVFDFERKHKTSSSNLINVCFILSILSIVGFAGLFSVGVVLLLVKLFSSPPEWFMILFYVFVAIGAVGSILGVFSLLAVRKKARYGWFYLLGICTCLIGNVFFGPILIITGNKIKNKQ